MGCRPMISLVANGVTSGDIDRGRLTRAIRDTPPGGLCLVVGPRGYGATTAVRHALHRDTALWVTPASCEPLDTALKSALDVSTVETEVVHAALQAAGAQWLVLDGLIEEPPPELVRLLAQALPPDTRLVITGCMAWDGLVRGPLVTTLITREQLAFTALEAQALLEQFSSEHTPAQTGAAVEWCEGWPLAVKLAAARLRHQSGGSPDDWLLGEGADALVSPWLDTLTDEQREFLLSTELLDELEVGLCNAVRQRDDAARLLAEMTRRPGLLWRLPPDDGGIVVWHRHRLLTEVLRARAAGDSGRREAHSRAARWFEEEDRIEPAVFHLLEAGRNEEAGNLLRQHESEFLSTGDARRTLLWYRRLSPQGWTESAEHWFRIGWGHLLSGDPQGARESLVHLNALAQSMPPEGVGVHVNGWFPGNLALLEAKFAAFSGDPVTMANQAERSKNSFDSGQASNPQQLAPLEQALGLLWQGEVAAARGVLAEVDTGFYPNAIMREVVHPGVDALVAWTEGRVRHARHMVARADAWLQDSGPELDSRALGALGIARALVKAESGDLEAALATIASVEEAARARAHTCETTAALLVRARVLLWMGNPRAAHEVLAAGREQLLVSCPSSAMKALIDELDALALLRLGEGVRAERLIRRLPNSAMRDLLAMRLLSASGAAPAAKALTSMRPRTPRIAALRRLELAAYFLGRDEALTRSHLYAAGAIAHEHGMTLLLRDYPALWPVARDAAERSAHEGLAVLVQPEQTVNPQAPLPRFQPVPVAEPDGFKLSSGERDLLELLPTRSSNAQIAEQLGVSLNTVKTRLQRLYRKLGVSSRDDAVAVVSRRSAG